MQINIQCIKKAQHRKSNLCFNQKKSKQTKKEKTEPTTRDRENVTKHRQTDFFLMALVTLSGNQDTKLLDGDFFVLVLL